MDYTTSCITTKNSFVQKYGCFSAKVSLPSSGICNAAFWLGTPDGKIFYPNPNSKNAADNAGELDIFEYSAAWGEKFSTDIHYFGYGTYHKHSPLSVSAPGIQDGDHIYSLVWMKDYLYIYCCLLHFRICW